MTEEKITGDMTLGEVVQKYPESALVMMKYGLHCVGCHIASWETVKQGAMAHGMSEKDLKKMLEELNQVASKKNE